MRFKFIQINIYKGKYLDTLVEFLKQEKPDFVSMQEVTGGGENLCDDKSLDITEYLKQKLSMDAVFEKEYDISDISGYLGNAVLTKHKIETRNVVTLKPTTIFTTAQINDPEYFDKTPTNVVDCVCNIGQFTFHIMSTHGAWTAPPQDTVETIRQAGLVADYLKKIKEPFVLGGDFNNVIQSKTIGIINRVANNLLFDSAVLETTNPKVHKIAPRGYLIDFIFVSRNIKLIKLSVPQITVSDHLPLVAEFEI